jgi:hypothetical protein
MADTERDNTLNYLDIFIHRTPMGIKTSICKKLTFTDTIIPYTSNHPTQHKYATVKFLYNRLSTYDLQKEEHEHELNIIHNNSFSIKHQMPHIHTLSQKKPCQAPKHRQATFTYVGKETFYITNILRQTDLRIAFCTNNTIGRLLTQNKPPPDKFSLSGVYKLTCPECQKAYVGQIGRRFNIRYNEHKQAFWNNSHSSSFAKQLN